jgi:hypothetical protein
MTDERQVSADVQYVRLSDSAAAKLHCTYSDTNAVAAVLVYRFRAQQRRNTYPVCSAHRDDMSTSDLVEVRETDAEKARRVALEQSTQLVSLVSANAADESRDKTLRDVIEDLYARELYARRERKQRASVLRDYALGLSQRLAELAAALEQSDDVRTSLISDADAAVDTFTRARREYEHKVREATTWNDATNAARAML